MKWAIGEKSYFGQILTGFQAASHLANAPWWQQPENSLEEYLATFLQCSLCPLCEPGENHLLYEKKIRTRSLAEAKLVSFFMVLFVILKCNSNLSILINQHFHTFNWPHQVLIVQKEIQYQFPHSKLFPDSGLVCIYNQANRKTIIWCKQWIYKV